MKSLINFFKLTILIIAISKNIVAYPSQNISKYDVASRIVGGSRAKDGDFPYVAGLALKHKSGMMMDCTGSLISYTSILTAAHCMEGVRSAKIFLGARDVSGYSSERTIMTFVSYEFIIYPYYRDSEDVHDLAIIKLPYPVIISDHIKLIRIPRSDEWDYAGASDTTMGWGKTSLDRNIDLTTIRYETNTILTNSDCQKMALRKYVIEDTHICLSGEGDTSTCHGDSGAPLVVITKSKSEHGYNHVQVGVLSFGSSKCRSGQNSVFIRLSKYITWLTANS